MFPAHHTESPLPAWPPPKRQLKINKAFPLIPTSNKVAHRKTENAPDDHRGYFLFFACCAKIRPMSKAEFEFQGEPTGPKREPEEYPDLGIRLTPEDEHDLMIASGGDIDLYEALRPRYLTRRLSRDLAEERRMRDILDEAE